jgi:hypothetical protein
VWPISQGAFMIASNLSILRSAPDIGTHAQIISSARPELTVPPGARRKQIALFGGTGNRQEHLARALEGRFQNSPAENP